MANIEFFTGFEGCGSNADAQSFFDSVYSSSIPAYSATGGYNDGKCMKSSMVGAYMTKNISGTKTVVVGLHIKNISTYSSYSTSANRHLLLFNGPTIRVFHAGTGIQVYRSSTLIVDTSVAISSSLVHIEVKLFSDASNGTLQIKVNGELVIDESGLNTGGSDITSITIGCTYSADVYYDNIFIADDWCGELKSHLVKPSSDIAVDFTPSAGSDNYAMVDDAAQDGDTTYVEADTVGHADLYGYEDAPAGIDIKAVSLVTVAKKTDAGDRAIKHIARQDAADYDLDEFYLGTDYPAAVGAGIFEVLSVAPDGSAWTPSIFNAISWGFEVSV